MTAGPRRYWCEHARIGDRVESAVTIETRSGRIHSIGAGTQPSPDDRRLAGFTIPGLANTHSHAFHRALRSRTQSDRGSFWTWRDLMYRAALRLDPDCYHRLARATFAEMALAGISVVGEFHYVHHQPDGTPYADPNEMGVALLSAASEAGIRITLLDTLYLHGGLNASGYIEPTGTQRRFSDGSSDSWGERVDRLTPTDGQRIGSAIHSVRAVDPHALKRAAQWATAHDAPIHAHVSEQVAENESCLAHHGCTPTGLLEREGALSSRFSAVHATHLASDDIDALAAAGSSVAMCPTTERDLGDGIGPTGLLAEADVALTVGSDSNAVIDLLDEARALELDERLRSERRGIHSAQGLLDVATANGHRSLGWHDAGAIAVGNRADLVTIALDSVRTAGSSTSSVVEAAIFAATASDVTDVTIDGREVVVDGQHTTLDVAAELESSITELMDR